MSAICNFAKLTYGYSGTIVLDYCYEIIIKSVEQFINILWYGGREWEAETGWGAWGTDEEKEEKKKEIFHQYLQLQLIV